MGKNDYKVVILGATAVGKSIFLGSYFYADRYKDSEQAVKGKFRYHIAYGKNTKSSTINELIGSLFEKDESQRPKIKGTSERVVLDYSVKENGMNVQLADIPGGWTIDDIAKDANGVNADLYNADGVLIFLSAWDVLQEKKKKTKEFEDAITAHAFSINKIRECIGKKRADIPIYFIFTKGDLVAEENVGEEELKARTKFLFEQAQNRGADWVFPTGSRVKAFLSTALGKWQWVNAQTPSDKSNYQTPPDESDYAPVNVVEPMEELLDDMKAARDEYRRRVTVVVASWCVGLLLAGAVTFGGTAFVWQRNEWTKAVEQAALHEAHGEYKEAIQTIEKYRDKGHRLYTKADTEGEIKRLRNSYALFAWAEAQKKAETFRQRGEYAEAVKTLDTYLTHWRNDEAVRLIERLNVEYEQACYAKIEGAIHAAELGALPSQNSVSYANGKAAIEEYLGNTAFERINSAHYAAARHAEPYYALGWVVNAKLEKLEQITEVLGKINQVPEKWRNAVLDNLFAQLTKYLSTATLDSPAKINVVLAQLGQLPENWRPAVMNQLQTHLNNWLNNLNLESPEEINSVATQIGQLPESWRPVAMTYLQKQLNRWLANLKLENHNQIIEVLNKISLIPEEWRSASMDQLQTHVNSWLNNLKLDSPEEIYNVSAQIRQLPESWRPRAMTLLQKQLNRWLSNLKLESHNQIIEVLNKIPLIPEEWRQTVYNGLHTQINAWMEKAAPRNSNDPNVYSRAVKHAQEIMQHNLLPRELKALLNRKTADWSEQEKHAWTRKVTAELDGLKNKEFEWGISHLDDLLHTPGLPESEAKRLREEKEPLYEGLVREWLNDSPKPEEIENKLRVHKNVPAKARNLAMRYIENYKEEQNRAFTSKIQAATSLDRLEEIWKSIERELKTDYAMRDALCEHVANKLQSLLKEARDTAIRNLEKSVAEHDFAAAKVNLGKSSANMRSKAPAFSNVQGVNLIHDTDKWKAESVLRLSDGELAYCKGLYTDLKSPTPSKSSENKIRETLKALESYKERWKDESWDDKTQTRKENEMKQVKAAIEYLEAVQSKREVAVRVVSMNCESLQRWYSSVTFKKMGVFKGRVVAKHSTKEDNSDEVKGLKPEFNWTFKFEWTPQAEPVVFKAYDGDIDDKDDLCFAHSVDCRGIEGWKAFSVFSSYGESPKTLNNQSFDNGVTMRVELVRKPENLPESPW